MINLDWKLAEWLDVAAFHVNLSDHPSNWPNDDSIAVSLTYLSLADHARRSHNRSIAEHKVLSDQRDCCG